MTTQEYAKVAYLIKNAWPGQFDADNVAAYAEFLMPYDAGAVTAALHKLATDGQRLVPSVGLVIRTVTEMDSEPVPSWTEAWAQITKMFDRAGKTYGDHNQITPYSLPVARYGSGIAHPVVIAFCESYGLRNLGMLETGGEHGTLRLRELSRQFAEFCQVRQERERRVLANAATPELQARRPELASG